MLKELKAQQTLVDITFKKVKAPKDERGLKAYKFLVFYRFFEVLSNAYPIFFSMVDIKRFEKIVYKFMQSGATSNVMWKVPNEFRKFVKKQKHFREFKYIDDLLWFEWIEVKLLMKSKKSEIKSTFHWKQKYALNSSAVIRKLKYKVFEAGSYDQRDEYFLLAYYDFDEKKVYYREISKVLYLFLEKLHTCGLKKAIKSIAELTGEDTKAVKDFFQNTLEELHTLRVLKEIS